MLSQLLLTAKTKFLNLYVEGSSVYRLSIKKCLNIGYLTYE